MARKFKASETAKSNINVNLDPTIIRCNDLVSKLIKNRQFWRKNMMNLHADSPHPLFQYLEKSVLILEKKYDNFYLHQLGREIWQISVWCLGTVHR